MSVKISKHQTIVKTHLFPEIYFTADVAQKIATVADIGMDVDKLASGLRIRYFSGIYLTNNFLCNIYAYNGGIYFVTNASQKLQFRVDWEEFI